LRKVYSQLGVDNYTSVQPKIEEYLKGLGTFRKNTHTPVSAEMKELVTQRWGASFDEFGYDKLL